MKRAFSIFEILIVLILLGVVVSFTLPHLKGTNTVQKSIQTDIKREQNTIGLKKAQQTLQKIEMMATQANGPIGDWDRDSDVFERYFIPYMNIAKKCKDTESGCFTDEISSGVKINTERYTKVLTLDGIGYAYDSVDRVIYVDTNGLNKPNELNEDIFKFEIHPDRGIILIVIP